MGRNAKQFQSGDEVFGRSSGGYTEYACVTTDELFLKPTGMSFEKAAAIPLSTFTSLICLCDLGQMKSGQKVLVNGASGGVGTLAVPFAKSFGAEVTGMLETLLVIFDLEPLIILVIPNGLFELTIGLWLMLKGIRLYKIESYKLKRSATTYYSILKGIKLKLNIILK